MRRMWLSSWLGIIYVVAACLLALAYVSVFGPMFGEWGWLQLTIALLVLGTLVIAGISALDHQPNPYSRTDPLYNLEEVPEQSRLQGPGITWVGQLIPMIVAIVVLVLVAWYR